MIKLPDEIEEVYRVKLEAKGDIAEVGLQDLVPLGMYYRHVYYIYIH